MPARSASFGSASARPPSTRARGWMPWASSSSSVRARRSSSSSAASRAAVGPAASPLGLGEQLGDPWRGWPGGRSAAPVRVGPAGRRRPRRSAGATRRAARSVRGPALACGRSTPRGGPRRRPPRRGRGSSSTASSWTSTASGSPACSIGVAERPGCKSSTSTGRARVVDVSPLVGHPVADDERAVAERPGERAAQPAGAGLRRRGRPRAR